MNEGYVKVSWENNAKTGEAENVVIDTEASATEEATAACLMMRHDPRRETAGIWAGRLATAFAARFRAVDPQKTSYSL